jgi:hypothetical protein
MDAQNNQPKSLLLRDSHPQFFKGLVLKVAMLLTVGVLCFIKPSLLVEQHLIDESTIPLSVWGAAFICIAVLMAYGLSSTVKRYRYARRALIAGAVISGIWAMGYLFAVIGGESDRGGSVIFWFFVCGNFIIWSGEPPTNPLSSALREREKEDEANRYA